MEHIADGVAHLPQPKCHLSNLPDVRSLVRVRLQHVAWGEGGRGGGGGGGGGGGREGGRNKEKSMHM